MFNKTTKSTARPTIADVPPLPEAPHPAPVVSAASVPAPAAPTRSLSTLAADLHFEGVISGNGDLQVDGAVKGDIRVGRLIIGETGSVEGAVNAEYLEVRGRIVGGVSGRQVKLIATAYVDGDITAEQLSIDIGAYFQGRVLQSRREAPAPTPAPAPAPTPAPAPVVQPTSFSAPATPAPATAPASAQASIESALDAVPLRPL